MKPNFVFIFPDQWRGDCLSYLNHPVVETPFLDELAYDGITFDSSYSACPSCIATRACVVTGQTPSTNGRLGYEDFVTWNYRNTLMECLSAGGYQTFCAGKTHFHPFHAKLGFDEIRLYDVFGLFGDGVKSDYHVWLEKAGNGMVRDTVQEIESNCWLPHPWTHPEYLHPTTWTVDASLELIDRRDTNKPFFIQVGFHRPHPPLDPPIEYLEIYRDKKLPPVPVMEWAEKQFGEPVKTVAAFTGRLTECQLERMRKAYYAQLSHIDYQIGRLIFNLRSRKLLDNTYIIFISDHGYLLGDHHMHRKVKPFEGSAKVPFIIKPPKNFECKRGTKCSMPTTHMDIMPTVLEAAGLEIPQEVEGMSILPLIAGKEVKWRDFVHGEHVDKQWGWQFVTDGREKFIWDSVSGMEMFFDLTKDPQEINDLSKSSEHHDVIELWRDRLIKVLSERPQDGLSDGERLIPGKLLPSVRPELLK